MKKKQTKTNTCVEGSAPVSPDCIMGFDCANSTGVAVNNYGVLTHVETVKLHKLKTTGTKLAEFRVKVRLLLSDFRPDLVVVEEPHLRGRGSFLTVGLYTVVLTECALLKIPVASVHTQSLKKFAGSGNFGKEEMVKAAGEFAIVHNDDEADAVHLTRWGAANFGGWGV